MGEYFRIIMPDRVMLPEQEAEALGKRMLTWLQNKRWVGTTRSDDGGYPLTRKAAELIRQEDWTAFAWLADRIGIAEDSAFGSLCVEVADTPKVVHHSGQGGLESAWCPKCGEDMGDQFYELIDVWWQAKDNPELPCPLCEELSPISAFRLDPAWGFSNLSFHFSINGNFHEAFLAAFAKELGEPARLVSGKL